MLYQFIQLVHTYAVILSCPTLQDTVTADIATVLHGNITSAAPHTNIYTKRKGKEEHALNLT